MRICVVTVYNSENCGSILQAYALGEKIKQLGHEVVYLERDIKGTGASTSHVLRVLAKSAVTGNWKNIPLRIAFHNQCKLDTKYFATINSSELEDVDCFVLGSDTIWQLNSPYFANNMKKYWGLSLPENKKIISYAPSVNDSPEDMFSLDVQVKRALNRLAAISVRDSYTKNIISKLTERNIELVCDPTMLHTVDFYKKIQRNCIYNDFILIYAFREFCTEKQIDEIKAFAKANAKRLVSFGVYRKWCDISVPFDAFAMPSYFENAESVITNTFHGTVFSILYNKKFADFAYNSRKVIELLTHFELMDHMVQPSQIAESALMLEIDEKKLQKKIEQIRRSSIQYLTEHINTGV